MGVITGLTADRMLEIENGSVVAGAIVGSDLILTRHDGTTLNAGEVKGKAGTNGVTPIFRGVSATSLMIELGSKTFALSPAMNLPFVLNAVVRASSSANPNNYMLGFVTASTTASVTINVVEIGGEGTFADWSLTLGGFQGPPGAISVSPAGGVLAGNYPNPTLAPDSVGTTELQDGSVTRDKLAIDSGVVGPDLVTLFLANGPMILAHRGAHNLYPENSLEGMRATAQAGFAPELDLRYLASGQIVAIHDATVDRTMTGTGTVSDLALSEWRNMAIKPQIQNGQQAMGALWDDILADLGGRYLLVPEIKLAGTQDAIISPVIARGYQRAVIFQSFDLPTAQAVAAAGCTAMLLTGATIVGTTPDAVKASGIDFVGFSSAVLDTDVAAAKAAGLAVLIYTIDTVTDYNTSITTKDADGVFTDDPWHVSGRFPVKSSDPFQARDAWPHFVGYSMDTHSVLSAATLSTTRLQYAPPTSLRRYNYVGTDASTLTVGLGWAGQKRGPRIRARFSATFLEASSSNTRWVGMFLGTQTSSDDVYHDEATPGQNGYHFLVRRNGALEIYRVAPNAAPVNLVTSAVPATPLAVLGARSQSNRFEIVIDATSVNLTNLTTGLTVTSANTAFRGLSRVDLTCNGTDAEWSAIGVEDLA